MPFALIDDNYLVIIWKWAMTPPCSVSVCYFFYLLTVIMAHCLVNVETLREMARNVFVTLKNLFS